MNLNTQIFYFFHNLSGKSKAVDWLIVFFGEYFFYFFIAFFLGLVIWYFVKRRRKEFAFSFIALVSAIVVRFGIVEIIRMLYSHPRPFLVLPISHLLNDFANSFPSGHTSFSFALATGVYFFNKKLSYLFFVSGLLMGVARIMGGVHWPFDIVGGIILGVGVAVFIRWIIVLSIKKRMAQRIQQ